MEDNTTSENEVTTRSTGIRYGLFTGLVSILYFVVLNVAGVDTTEGIGRWASLLFTIALIYLAHQYYKENGDGFMTIGQGIGIGFWLGLVSSVLSSIFTWVYIKFIDDTFVQQLLDKQREAMEERGMDDEQIDQAMEMTARFMTPELMFVFGLIGGVIIIVITSIIVSLVTQKKNPEATF